MTLPLSYDTVIPKYQNGKWFWNDENEKFTFHSTGKLPLPDYIIPSPKITFGIQFKDYMDQNEEFIFGNKFVRSKYSNDSDVITIQDIKNLAFFTVPSNHLTNLFIHFFYTDTNDQFLNDLIIYFEYFIKVVEFLLIRRDDITGENVKIRNLDSVKVERMISEYLCQYRLILAREYSKIILGEDDVKKYHHRENKMHISMSNKDQKLFEIFLNFCTRIIWIAMHRKAYKIIDCEINRLFRSGHFNVAEKQLKNCLKFTKREQQVLYGPNDIRANYRNQKSPIILEILRISPKNTEVLWIGENNYRGTDPRLFNLELEYVTPESQLSFVDIQHGILGHPKDLYNTMLELNRHAVRKENFTDDYDPYFLARAPYLQIPKWSEFIKKHDKSKPLFKIERKKINPKIIHGQCRLWKERDEIMKSTGTFNFEDDNIIKKCNNELENIDYLQYNRSEIIDNFIREKQRKLKGNF